MSEAKHIDSIAVAFALTRLRFSLPYRLLRTAAFALLELVARREARHDNYSLLFLYFYFFIFIMIVQENTTAELVITYHVNYACTACYINNIISIKRIVDRTCRNGTLRTTGAAEMQQYEDSIQLPFWHLKG